MPAIAQTFSTDAAALGANITWNQAGGGLEINTCPATFGVGTTGITCLRNGLYMISASAKFQLTGARNQGNIEILLNGAQAGPADLHGSATYHRSAGSSPAGVQLGSVLSGVWISATAGDVISCAIQRVDGNTTNGTLTLNLARLSVSRNAW